MAGRGLDRFVISLLEGCCRQLWGFSPRMIGGVIGDKGAARGFVWFAANLPRYLITMRVLGPVRTHLACATISLHNSCVYCAFGQAYALELIYLRDTGRLFPLDTRLLSDWLHLEPRRLAVRMRGVLEQAGLHNEAVWVDLTLGLVTGEQQPIDDAEARVAHLVRMVSELNRIANATGAEPDGAQDPINKDTALKATHAALRQASPSGQT
jgi:hypothetical protein